MCGIFGLISKEKVTEEILQALLQLQHRGQDAAGVYTYHPRTKKHYFRKNCGLVSQVFPPELKHFPEATVGIGHVRYSTIGKGCVEDAQPLYASGVTIAHNGNVVNYLPAKNRLQDQGFCFTSMCDVEIILAQLLTCSLGTFEEVCTAVKSVFTHIQGAYSCVAVIVGLGLIAFRDPHGIRPLLMGVRSDGSVAFASETSPLSILDFEKITDVAPGEVVFVDYNLQIRRKLLKQECHRHCGFEYNYFAKPNAILESQEVYRVRANLGVALAKKIREAKIEADVIVPIPDTSRPAAIALSQELGLPLEEGFVKHGYVGRTFIMPTQAIRRQAVIQKLAPVISVFKGRKVILTDDSIVRGTVSSKVVALARSAGADKIYFASTYPAIRFPCVYGIDFPQQNQLMAYGRTDKEICEEIGVDGLVFNDVVGYKNAVGIQNLCTACLTGEYPTAIDGIKELQEMREDNLKELEMTCKT